MKKRTGNKNQDKKINKEDLEKIKQLERILKYTFANKAWAAPFVARPKSFAAYSFLVGSFDIASNKSASMYA